MIFHLNQHLVRITDIKRSFTETDFYISLSLEIRYFNIDNPQNLTKTPTSLSPHWNFFLENEKFVKVKIESTMPPHKLQ